MRGLLPAAVFDPRATGCFTCRGNLAEVRSDPSLYGDLVQWGLVLTIAWGTGLAVRTVWRWLRAPRVVRLVNAPLVLGGAVIALLAAAAAMHALQLPMSEIDTTLRTWWLAQCGLVALMAAGVAASGLRARRLAGKVTEVVLAAVPDADSLRQTLAASIDDPDLALVFPRDDGHAVDAAGRRVGEADDSLAVVRVTRADAVVAEVRYRASLAGASHQLAASVRAAGLGVEHLAARARLRAELAELAVSRLRIVEAGDAERRSLERDLHDGAQQRLIALQVLLQMASTAAPPARSARYADARGEVGVALEELRDLAHGIHPVVLTDAGLGVGLRTLAESSPVPLIVQERGSRRRQAAVEAAAYRLVEDTIRTAGQTSSSTCRHRNPQRRRECAADPAEHDWVRRDRRRAHRDPRAGPYRGAQRVGHACHGRRPDDDRGGDSVRLVIAEDMALLREGLTRLLTDTGFDVVGGAGDLAGLLDLVARTAPDVALIDIKMPPTHTDEGLQAATAIRQQYPGTAVLLLSSYLESRYASALLEDHPASSGYLLKERVYDSSVLGDALRRVCAGQCVIDPAIVAQLLSRSREHGPLDELTEREREILSLMAEGHSNHSICGRLIISPRTVESHVRSVFIKLGLAESPDSSRRVLAVLTFLQA